MSYFQQLGLRERILTLPVMMALVLSMIWRQIGSVLELTRMVQEEVLLWAEPQPKLTEKSIALRLRSLPAELFWRVLNELLPLMKRRWEQRVRPLVPELAWAQTRYTEVVACDGSTLDALLRKVGLLAETVTTPLAGRMLALLDLCSHLPRQVWYEPDAEAHDQRFWPKILPALKAGSLLIFDLGFTNFQVFAQLTQAQVTFITRAKSNLAYQVERTLFRAAAVHDELVWIGGHDQRQLVRLVCVLYQGRWYRYLSNELDVEQLPVHYLVALYWQRWRIEIVFTQMTKGRVFTLGAGWDHVANLDLVVVHDDAVDQQFYQLPSLGKTELFQGWRQALAVVFDVGRQLDHIQLLLGLKLQLAELLPQPVLSLG